MHSLNARLRSSGNIYGIWMKFFINLPNWKLWILFTNYYRRRQKCHVIFILLILASFSRGSHHAMHFSNQIFFALAPDLGIEQHTAIQIHSSISRQHQKVYQSRNTCDDESPHVLILICLLCLKYMGVVWWLGLVRFVFLTNSPVSTTSSNTRFEICKVSKIFFTTSFGERFAIFLEAHWSLFGCY